MSSDPPPERYWELLAEERRLALQEALEENERVNTVIIYDVFLSATSCLQMQ